MRLPLSEYSRCEASARNGVATGASAARACTPGRAIAAAVRAASRPLIAATAASADAGGGGAALLRAVGAQLLSFLLRRIVDRHHRLGERSALPRLHRRAAGGECE